MTETILENSTNEDLNLFVSKMNESILKDVSDPQFNPVLLTMRKKVYREEVSKEEINLGKTEFLTQLKSRYREYFLLLEKIGDENEKINEISRIYDKFIISYVNNMKIWSNELICFAKQEIPIFDEYDKEIFTITTLSDILSRLETFETKLRNDIENKRIQLNFVVFDNEQYEKLIVEFLKETKATLLLRKSSLLEEQSLSLLRSSVSEWREYNKIVQREESMLYNRLLQCNSLLSDQNFTVQNGEEQITKEMETIQNRMDELEVRVHEKAELHDYNRSKYITDIQLGREDRLFLERERDRKNAFALLLDFQRKFDIMN